MWLTSLLIVIVGLVSIAEQTQKVKAIRSSHISQAKELIRPKTVIRYNGPMPLALIDGLKKYIFSVKYCINEKSFQMFTMWCEQNGNYSLSCSHWKITIDKFCAYFILLISRFILSHFLFFRNSNQSFSKWQ